MLSPKTKIGDRVLVEGELISGKTGGHGYPEHYIVQIDGNAKPVMVLPSMLRSWEQPKYLVTDRDYDEDRTALAQNIRQHRQRLNMTQAELAARCGVTQATVAYWEAGRAAPIFARLLKAADALGVDARSLIGDRKEVA